MRQRSSGLFLRRGRLLLGVALLLLASWTPARAGDEVRVVLTADEQAWLDAHPTIKMAPDPKFPPYESIDESGEFVGITADYVRIVEARLGIKFTIVKNENWAKSVEDLKTRRADMWASAVVTEDREEYMAFAEPHVAMPSVILGTDPQERGITLEALHGKKVALVAGYFWQEQLAKSHPQIQMMPSPDIESGLQMLSFGIADYMVNDPATSAWFIRKGGLTNIKIVGRVTEERSLSMAVRSDWAELVPILNKALASVSPAERAAIEKRWVQFDVGAGQDSFDWTTTLWALVIVLGLILGVLVWNRTLKRKVSAQTERIRRELEQRLEVQQAVVRTTVDVTSAATEISASAQRQAETAESFESSTAEAADATQGIATTLEALLRAVESVNHVAAQTTERAEAGGRRLKELDGIMHVMADATTRMGERVQRIQKSAEKIKLATVAMVKVVDQTNLLSVNSAIEAEKAG